MKREQAYRLLEAIGEIRDETVQDAFLPSRHSHSRMVKAAAAAAVLICGGIMAYVMKDGYGIDPGPDSGTPTHAAVSDTQAPPFTGETSADTETTTKAETGAQTPGAAFSPVTSTVSPIVYSGPILPLTAEGDTSGLRVVRQLTVYPDRDSYRETSFPDFAVTDCYVIENTADADKTVTLLYPVITECSSDSARWPVIELRGQNRRTTLSPAVYAGIHLETYTGGSAEDTSTLNPTSPDTWEDYAALLSDGSYRRDAFSIKNDGSPELQKQLHSACEEYRQNREKYYDFVPDTFLFESLPEELLLSIVYEELLRYGPAGETPLDRWTVGVSHTMEKILQEILAQKRVFYLSFTVTIPAGVSEIVFIEQERPASYDYRDMSLVRIDAAVVDTALPFARQDFIVLEGEKFEIVRTSEPIQQNTGGITLPLQTGSVWVDLRNK